MAAAAARETWPACMMVMVELLIAPYTYPLYYNIIRVISTYCICIYSTWYRYVSILYVF